MNKIVIYSSPKNIYTSFILLVFFLSITIDYNDLLPHWDHIFSSGYNMIQMCMAYDMYGCRFIKNQYPQKLRLSYPTSQQQNMVP